MRFTESMKILSSPIPLQATSFCPVLPMIFRGFWGCRNSRQLPLGPREHLLLLFISAGSTSSILQLLSCCGSHIALTTSAVPHWVPHPCSKCCFLGWPPLCSYKARKVGPRVPLCPRQVLVHTIPEHLRDSRTESSALMDEAQPRGFKANSCPALGTQRAWPRAATPSPPRGLTSLPSWEESSRYSRQDKQSGSIKDLTSVPRWGQVCWSPSLSLHTAGWRLMSDCRILSVWAARDSQENRSSLGTCLI